MSRSIKEIEPKLWSAADALRGNLSAEEYMHIVLGILSLKYISDRYEFALKQLKEDGFDPDEIESAEEFYYDYNAFLVPKKAQWNYIMEFTSTPSIGLILDEAFVELEKENSMLKGIFNKDYNREGIDQVKLGEVIRIFSDENFSEDGEDLIGRIYEYFLGHFFKDRGQKGGEFYTPTSIVKLMVNILKPMSGNIYDPACGTGGILVQSKRYIENHNGDLNRIMVFGQEYNNVTWKLAKLNLILNGFPLEDENHHHQVLGEMSADTFTNDQHKTYRFDYVMANPPFNIKSWNQEKLLDDPRWKWGIPPKGNANYAWISHIVSKLNSSGRAAIVLANGSLSSSQKDELLIRKNLVEENKVDAIIELPDKLFYTTGIPAALWFFNNNKKTNNILMIAGSSIQGNMVSKKLRELTNEDIDKIVNLFDKHENGEEINELGFAKTISKEELFKNDYSFIPGRYVGIIEEKNDKEKIQKEIKALSLELNELLDEFNDLVPDIKKTIAKIKNT